MISSIYYRRFYSSLPVTYYLLAAKRLIEMLLTRLFFFLFQARNPSNVNLAAATGGSLTVAIVRSTATFTRRTSPTIVE